MKTDLEKLRARARRLEAKIAANASASGRLAGQLSDCKKYIAKLTVGKMRTA